MDAQDLENGQRQANRSTGLDVVLKFKLRSSNASPEALAGHLLNCMSNTFSAFPSVSNFLPRSFLPRRFNEYRLMPDFDSDPAKTLVHTYQMS